MTSHLVPPHGGRLALLMASPARVAELVAHAKEMASWSLAYRRYFRPHFKLRRAYGLGFLLPEHRVETLSPRVAGWLGRLERRLGTIPPFVDLSRYYVLDLEPRPEIVEEPRREL